MKRPAMNPFLFIPKDRNVQDRGTVMKTLPVLFMILAVLAILCPAAALGGETGWIDVQCNVDGASVYFDGTYKGVTANGLLTVEVYTTGSPYRTLTVEKAGYSTFTGSLTMPAAGQTTSIYANLVPVYTPTPTQYGSIRVESSPSGAEIYFNGDYRGQSPITISQVWPGTYTIMAEKDGYRTYTTTVTVTSGRQADVYCSLSPLSTTGSLYVLSNPSGANIYVDTAYKGQTPMTVTNLASGTHILEVDHSGYYDWKSTVDVLPGGTKTITATLNPMPVSNTGWLYVASSPGGATVTLDGSSVGQTPYSGSLKLNNVVAGSHTVTLTIPGYAVYTTAASVSPNTVSEINAILTATSPVTSTGGLSVSSTPSGAKVLLDNNFMGITPLDLTSVATGSHTVTIQMDGYQDYSVTTPVNAGATSTVAAALVPATKATPRAPLPALVAIAAFGLAAIAAGRKFR